MAHNLQPTRSAPYDPYVNEKYFSYSKDLQNALTQANPNTLKDLQKKTSEEWEKRKTVTSHSAHNLIDLTQDIPENSDTENSDTEDSFMSTDFSFSNALEQANPNTFKDILSKTSEEWEKRKTVTSHSAHNLSDLTQDMPENFETENSFMNTDFSFSNALEQANPNAYKDLQKKNSEGLQKQKTITSQSANNLSDLTQDIPENSETENSFMNTGFSFSNALEQANPNTYKDLQKKTSEELQKQKTITPQSANNPMDLTQDMPENSKTENFFMDFNDISHEPIKKVASASVPSVQGTTHTQQRRRPLNFIPYFAPSCRLCDKKCSEVFNTVPLCATHLIQAKKPLNPIFVGNQIKAAREQKKYEIIDIASPLNVVESTVFCWEKGRHCPSLTQLVKVAEMLSKPLTYFLEDPTYAFYDFQMPRFKQALPLAELGKNLRQARMEKKLSPDELADLLGVQVSSVYNWEDGNRRPGKKSREALAKVLDKPFEYF